MPTTLGMDGTRGCCAKSGRTGVRHPNSRIRGFEKLGDPPQFAGMAGSHAPRVVIFEQSFQALVPYRPDYSLI